MRLIKSSVEIIPQQSGLINGYKHIEKAARNCYKSEDKITDESYKTMMDILSNKGHMSPTEHCAIYLTMQWDPSAWKRYTQDPFSVINIVGGFLYISTNLRVIIENGWQNDLNYMVDPTPNHELRITAKVVCSEGIAREWNRHRTMSISQQSTRYCNYSKDKFGNELTFIIPEWVKTCLKNKQYDPVEQWCETLENCEVDYMSLISCGLKPQEARSVLVLDTATCVFYSAYIKDWKKFFELRCSNAAHPDIRILADDLKQQMIENGYISRL